MANTFHDMRLNAGYKTQDELAERIGKKRASIAKWETGVAYPRHGTLPALARALNVTEGEIIAAITAAKQGDNHP